MVSFKIWILVIALISAFLFIAPFGYFEKGVEIKSVDKNSAEFESGLRAGAIITQINSVAVTNLADYSTAISKIVPTKNNPLKVSITTSTGSFVFIKNDSLSLIVGEISKSKLKTGLDLSGGARALIKAENHSMTDSEITDLVDITSSRFNVYGIKDLTIKPVKDLGGNNYLLIEIAGATPADLQELVGSQGKFEARMGNITLFVGGTDISHVERSGTQAGIEGCYPSETGGEFCRFRFPISLTEEAALRHANITSQIPISNENPQYLAQKLDLYVDGNLMDSLFVSKELKGQIATQISIQGSGSGANRQEALTDTQNQMKKLQTILITGSLPYKLEIVKLDTISPTLGKEFTKNLIYLALMVFGIISVLLFVKYRKVKITLAVILTMFSEAFITLGIAALIKWNLDVPSIAGIIAGMGTGVNDQIVIIDETNRDSSASIKERIKSAFFIIIGAFFTIFAAMLPLFWAGAGMLKGFALTTLIGVIIGILITRPAFAEILRRIKED